MPPFKITSVVTIATKYVTGSTSTTPGITNIPVATTFRFDMMGIYDQDYRTEASKTKHHFSIPNNSNQAQYGKKFGENNFCI